MSSEPTWDGGDYTACEHCDGLFCACCIEWCSDEHDEANGAWLCEDCRE